jgi:hypothetical protein
LSAVARVLRAAAAVQRVRVAPEVATVDFVRASLCDAGGGRQEKEANGAVVASYQVKPGGVRAASKGTGK